MCDSARMHKTKADNTGPEEPRFVGVGANISKKIRSKTASDNLGFTLDSEMLRTGQRAQAL